MSTSGGEENASGTEDVQADDQPVTVDVLKQQLQLSRQETNRLRDRVSQLEGILKGFGASINAAMSPEGGTVPQRSDIKTFVESYQRHLLGELRHSGQPAGNQLVADRKSYVLAVHLPKGERLFCEHQHGQATVDNYNLLQILKQIGFLECEQTLPYRMTLRRVTTHHLGSNEPVSLLDTELVGPEMFRASGDTPSPKTLFAAAQGAPRNGQIMKPHAMRCYAGENVKDYANQSVEFNFRFSKAVTSRNLANAHFCLHAVLDIEEGAWEAKWTSAGLEAPLLPSITSPAFLIRTNESKPQDARSGAKRPRAEGPTDGAR